MSTGLIVLGMSIVISAFFIWTSHNGQKRDRERDWGK
ncbi:hypothetical protein B0G84_8346 [Paraburkholderia sp. BL8N3]|nr:hypothetical protein B0G84_8346 [Paraburkholderia sp. BL8N3]